MIIKIGLKVTNILAGNVTLHCCAACAVVFLMHIKQDFILFFTV